MGKVFWIGLLTGIIIGWLIEWVIDWFYWRKKHVSVLMQLEAKKDDLKVIKGIRKIIEGRLNAAGIYTFARLAELTQPELEKIVGNAKNLSDEDDLIRRAKKKAKKK